MRRQFLKVRRSKAGRPRVDPSSVTSILKVRVRLGFGSPLSKICAMISSRKSIAAPSILGCSGTTSRRINSGARMGSLPGFAQLGDLVELALGRLFIDAAKNLARDEQPGQCPAPPPCPGVGCVANLGVVDIVAVVSAKILLSD